MKETDEKKELTDAEILLLGLVAEMPRHGYELEQVIEQRDMREWTQIGFSSIYFVLNKLEKARLVSAARPKGTKAKKTYTITSIGKDTLVAQSLSALTKIRPTYSSAVLGVLHWPIFERDEALDALRRRGEDVDKELTRLERIQFERQPLPDFVEALFDFNIGQLKAEAKWIRHTHEYMSSKPWLE